MSLHLNDTSLIRASLEAQSIDDVPLVLRSVPLPFLPRLIDLVAAEAGSSPHVEFYLRCALALMQAHTNALSKQKVTMLPAFRTLQKSVHGLRDALAKMYVHPSLQRQLQHSTYAPRTRTSC